MVREGMRGDDQQQNHLFSYLSPEERVRKDHPLRAIRTMVDEVLTQLSRRFGQNDVIPQRLETTQSWYLPEAILLSPNLLARNKSFTH